MLDLRIVGADIVVRWYLIAWPTVLVDCLALVESVVVPWAIVCLESMALKSFQALEYQVVIRLVPGYKVNQWPMAFLHWLELQVQASAYCQQRHFVLLSKFQHCWQVQQVQQVQASAYCQQRHFVLLSECQHCWQVQQVQVLLAAFAFECIGWHHSCPAY